jgi:hypothetical protein
MIMYGPRKLVRYCFPYIVGKWKMSAVGGRLGLGGLLGLRPLSDGGLAP